MRLPLMASLLEVSRLCKADVIMVVYCLYATLQQHLAAIGMREIVILGWVIGTTRISSRTSRRLPCLRNWIMNLYSIGLASDPGETSNTQYKGQKKTSCCRMVIWKIYGI